MKKLAIVLVTTVAICLTVWLWPDHPATAPTAAAPTSSAPIAAPAPPPSISTPSTDSDPAQTSSAPDQGPYSSRPEARRAWEPVVEGFAIAYSDTGHLTRRQWMANLRPFLAPSLYSALTDVDPGTVSAGRYAGYEILQQADESLTIRITYQQGWALVLYVVAVGDNHWIIDRFDRSLDWD